MSKLRPLIAILLLALPVVGMAQSQPRVASLEIDIWPEYDRPQALVIYQVRLAQDTPAGSVLTLPIPADVGEPHAVAAWHPDGSLDDDVTWSTTQQGAWTQVEVATEANGVWLEFYDEMTLQGDQRSYAFTWPGDIMVDSLSFDVLHPVGASDLRIVPAGEESQGTGDLTYSHLDLGAYELGQDFTIELSYTKSSAFTGELPSRPANPTFARFEVAFWPEYDRTATLVFYRAALSTETPLPAKVTLPIPAVVGEPYAVATLGSDDQLYDAAYERRVEGDWAWITFETESSNIVLEYYDDLVIDGASRSFSFFWPGSLETSAFAYELQRPIDAQMLRVTPAGVLQPDPSGLAFIRSELGSQQPGSPLTINFQYEKTSSDLTANAASSGSSIDRPATTQGGTPDLTSLLPYILGVVGLLLIGIGIFFTMRVQRRAQISRRRPRQRKPRSKPDQKAVELDAAAVFCHVCGAKASASDHFCRSCGIKLRQ
jgi:hypothetical protein